MSLRSSSRGTARESGSATPPLPGRVGRRYRTTQAVDQCGALPAVHSVGEPRVVSRDAEGQQLAELAAIAFDRDCCARSGVVDLPGRALESCLEVRGVLA